MHRGLSEARRPRRGDSTIQAGGVAGLDEVVRDAQGIGETLRTGNRAMTGRPVYTEYHPRWLRPHMSTYWWLGRWAYVKFILRELSSIFVAWFVVYLLLLLRAVARGETSYRAFIDLSANPVMLTVNVIAFFFITFHALTWFAVAPQAIVAH